MKEGIFRVQVSGRAIQHLHNGFSWYESQKIGLELEFIEEINGCFNQIALHPSLYTKVNAKFRRVRLLRFPYVIIYQVRGSVVLIAAVRHTKQKPMKRYGA